MPGSLVDLILLILVVAFAVNGYRQGFLVGALSFFGFFGGALIGLQIAPLIVTHIASAPGRVVISLVAVFGLALIGQTAAAWAGSRLRLAIHSRGARRADDIGGALVSVVALLIVAWMVAAPLASSALPGVARSVRNSTILGAVDQVMPNQARVFYNGLRDTIANSEFPNVFGDLTPTQVRSVPPPDPKLANSPAVAAAHRSVVKVLGTAPSCSRRIEGSGFIYAPRHVMTNAHVVAGTRGPVRVELNGDSYQSQVVYYDPHRDLAVLYVPDLAAPPMTWAATQASTGDNAIVIGYPLDGPFTAVSARIRDDRTVRGPDIYEDATVTRDVYVIRSRVLSGNSGGPLIAPTGQVLGVVFAAAVDDPQTGFALTAGEAAPVARAGASRTSAVSTGACA